MFISLPRPCFLLLCLLTLLLAPAGPAWAQQPRPAAAPARADSLRAQSVDSLRRRFDQQRGLVGLKAYARRKTIMGKLVAALFNFTERREEQAGLDATLLDRQYDRHNYKVVRNIDVRTLDAFGYSINDTTRIPRNFLEKGGNFFHLTTARRKVRNLLLFRPGQELQPYSLSETERLLRLTTFILDARVLVNERTSTKDSVDIKVITKDVFSLSGALQLRDVGSGVLNLRDRNFLARGHDFRNRLTYGLRGPQTWAYQGSYTVPLRNYVEVQGRYRNQWQVEEASAALARGFVAVNTRYAYGLSLSRNQVGLELPAPSPGEAPAYSPLRFHITDGWLGRAFQPRSYDLGYENPARVIVATRMVRVDYLARPSVRQYPNSTMSLLSLGYSVRRYYKDRYLFGFGRTEDVPTGSLLTLTGGYDFSQAVSRPYVSTRAALAAFSPLRGYLYVSGEYGRFVNAGRWREGAFSGELLFFTRLYHTGDWQWRHFFWHRSLIGIKRTPDELLLSIAGDRGVRALREDVLRGTSRFVLNYEANVFTPASFAGFRLAGIAFADAAWLSTNGSTSPFQRKPYAGFGVGLRFRNEYLSAPTIQVLLGVYPNGFDEGTGLRLYQTTRTFYRFNDFSFGQPGIVRYDALQ